MDEEHLILLTTLLSGGPLASDSSLRPLPGPPVRSFFKGSRLHGWGVAQASDQEGRGVPQPFPLAAVGLQAGELGRERLQPPPALRQRLPNQARVAGVTLELERKFPLSVQACQVDV